MRLPIVALVSFLVACASPPASVPEEVAGRSTAEQDVVTRARVLAEGSCDVPGRPELTGQARVRLVYVAWPHFHEELCSSELAAHLRATGAREVPVTVSFAPRGRGHALCDIAGIAAKRLPRGCSFEGVISGGLLSYGHQLEGENQLVEADLPPWEARARER